MNSRQVRALFEISAFHHPDPGQVFRRILELIAAEYDGTMAMINVVDGERIAYREIVNPHPLFRRYRSVHLSVSYCQFTTTSGRPNVLQNAADDPALAAHPAVRVGLTRYLAVPIHNPEGTAIGTLCFLDGRSHVAVGAADVEFLSLLAMRVSAELERERMMEERLGEERARAEQVARLNANLVAAAEEKRRMLAAVVHDLRQPLATMKVMLHLLAEEEDPDERAECLELFQSRVGALSALAEELMTYAEIESGVLAWELADVDLPGLIRDCAEELRAEIKARALALDLDLDACPPTCRTDAGKLRHILRNLLSNAMKFSAAQARGGGRVTVRARPSGVAHWQLEVEDNGIGIDPAALPHIFEEFYHAAVSPEATQHPPAPESRGLGLAIVKHLSIALGGRVEVRSAPGAGACFTVVLPRQASPDGGAAARRAASGSVWQ